MERNAFARAKAFLAYTSRAKGLAILAAIGASAFYVFLVLLLALLVDLLVSRGRIPTFARLSIPEQERFRDVWKDLPEDVREIAIQHIGLGEFAADSKAPPAAGFEEKRRFRLWSALMSTDNPAPIPAKMSSDGLKKWAETGKGTDDPYLQAMEEHELRWRAYVWHYLKERIGVDAANSYQPNVEPNDPLPIPGLAREDQTPHGALGLAVRLRGTFAGKCLNEVASFSPWMWEEGRARDPNRTYLTGLLILAIAATFLRTGCILAMNLQAATAINDAVTRLRRAVYHHASRLGDLSSDVHDRVAGDLIFTRHIDAIHDALYVWLTTAFRFSAQAILLLGLALFVQPWLTLAIVLFALLVWLMGGQIVAAFRRQGRASARRAASRLVLLLESIHIMRLVKSYLMELFNQARVERQLSEYAKAHRTRYRGEAIAKPVLILMIALAGITLLFLAGRIVLNDGVSLARLSILVAAVAGLFLPIRSAIDRKKYLRRGRESAGLLFEFLDRKGGNPQYADAEFLQPMSKSLEFKNVRFQEPGGSQPLLEDINLVVGPGEKIGVMGTGEDAKRALLYLIPRFFDPSEGEVRIDGRNLRWVSHESLRSQIGLVMNDRLIFNDTISTNIGCGDTSVSMPRIIEAAKLAHAHQFIQKLPYGYETPVGELGHSLRIGEQFRIALARAILRDPAIYIIEEPAEQLDDDTKSLLDDTFDRIFPGKTAILLPHRVSTLRHCDRIVLLHNGSIEAIGEHRDLVHTSGLYKHLYYLEFNAFADQT